MVIGLVVALFGSMFIFLFELLASRGRALEISARQLAASTLIERVEADLLTCLVGDRGAGAGVEGDAGRLRILTRGVAVSLAERGVDDPAVFGDLQVAEYRFNAATRRIEGRRAAVGDGDTDPGAYAPLGGPVHRMRFRFLDGAQWRESFDSLESDRLPVAVEIAVWFDPPAEDLSRPSAPPPPASTEPERLTFDATAGFDEDAHARRSDLDFEEPRPDRLRLIIIPDASSTPGRDGPAEADLIAHAP